MYCRNSGLCKFGLLESRRCYGYPFYEFNQYKKKSESGQVFTPDHITSFMYRLIDVDKNDRVLEEMDIEIQLTL